MKMDFTDYAKNVLYTFKKKCGIEYKKQLKEGTVSLYSFVENIHDLVAWYLITYDVYAIEIAKELKEIDHVNVIKINSEIKVDDLIEKLNKCFIKKEV